MTVLSAGILDDPTEDLAHLRALLRPTEHNSDRADPMDGDGEVLAVIGFLQCRLTLPCRVPQGSTSTVRLSDGRTVRLRVTAHGKALAVSGLGWWNLFVREDAAFKLFRQRGDPASAYADLQRLSGLPCPHARQCGPAEHIRMAAA